jgi:hypothetical protein
MTLSNTGTALKAASLGKDNPTIPSNFDYITKDRNYNIALFKKQFTYLKTAPISSLISSNSC